MIDALATLSHYLRYVAPVFEALPEQVKGSLYTNRRIHYPGSVRTGPETRTDDPIIVAGWHDLRKVPNRPVIFIEHGAGQCLAPETLVLTAALQYVPVSSLAVGDRLVAFEETPSNRKWRAWREATVMATQEIRRKCYRLHFADGTSIVASEEHLWLCRDRETYEWTLTANLQDAARWPSRSSKIIKCFDVWEPDDSWGGGYLAGAFDGEGCLTQTSRSDDRQNRMILTLAQKDNGLLAQVSQELAERRFRFSISAPNAQSNVCHLNVLGGTREVLRFVGSIRPRRLLHNLKPMNNGQMRGKPVELLAMEPIGEQNVIGLATSTGTLIAEGFATHNSYDTDNSAYSGGPNRDNVILFVCPNQQVADRNLARYPDAQAVVAGNPSLDRIHLTKYEPSSTVGLSWHWQCFAWPESQTAFYEYQHLLPELAKSLDVIGTGHPRIFNDLRDYYLQSKIESIEDMEEAFSRVGVWCADNSSSAMEFASTGRPIVWVSALTYRRDFKPGGRFWDWTAMGPHVESPEEWIPALTGILEEDRYGEMREEWVRRTYAFTDGHAAERAAEAILTMKGAF